jgi:hypothetical protein
MDEGDSDTIGRERIWRVVSTATGIVSAMVAKNLIRRAYRVIRRDEPTTAFDPTVERFSLPNALLWAVAGGVGLVVAKMVGDRLAAIGWKAATGSAPPGRSKASVG